MSVSPCETSVLDCEGCLKLTTYRRCWSEAAVPATSLHRFIVLVLSEAPTLGNLPGHRFFDRVAKRVNAEVDLEASECQSTINL